MTDVTTKVALAGFITASAALLLKYIYSAFISCLDSKTTWKCKSPCGVGAKCGCELSTDGSQIISSKCVWAFPCMCYDGKDQCCLLERMEEGCSKDGESNKKHILQKDDSIYMDTISTQLK
jgi:hypothetical protein